MTYCGVVTQSRKGEGEGEDYLPTNILILTFSFSRRRDMLLGFFGRLLIKFLDILAQYGPDLKRPYADMLREGIRELRVP